MKRCSQNAHSIRNAIGCQSRWRSSILDHRQPGHPSERIQIVGYQRMTGDTGGRCDPEIITSDEKAFCCQFAVEFSVIPGDFKGPWYHRIRFTKSFPIPVGTCGTTAGEFSGNGEGDEDFFVGMCGEKCVGPGGSAAFCLPLGGNDIVGVENQADGSPGMGSCLVASSTVSKYFFETQMEPVARLSRSSPPVIGDSTRTARLTTSEKDSPGFFAVRSFS